MTLVEPAPLRAPLLAPAIPTGLTGSHQRCAPIPVMVDVTGRRCVVVGSTPVADQRAAMLAAAGAEVVRLGARDHAAAGDPTLGAHAVDDLTAEALTAEVLASGAWLVFAATGSAQLDAVISRAAERSAIFSNAHDQPAACTFQMPARLQRGALSVAVGTGGAAPAAAVLVRDLIAAIVGPEAGELLETAADARRDARARGESAGSLDWANLLAPLVDAIESRVRTRALLGAPC